jgi:hypothetical protein
MAMLPIELAFGLPANGADTATLEKFDIDARRINRKQRLSSYWLLA